MYTTNLRKVGGSIMMALPPAILELLQLHAGATVGLAVKGERLIIEPQTKPHYSLDDLLDQCDPKAPLTRADRDWLNARSAGREL